MEHFNDHLPIRLLSVISKSVSRLARESSALFELSKCTKETKILYM